MLEGDYLVAWLLVLAMVIFFGLVVCLGAGPEVRVVDDSLDTFLAVRICRLLVIRVL